MKTERILKITKCWLAVCVMLALLPWVGISQGASILDYEFIWAAEREDLRLVETLLGKGADVNAKDQNSDTALMKASQNGRLEIVKLLLKRGADVNLKDRSGDNALSQAARARHLEVALLLKKHGAQLTWSMQSG